MLLYIQRDIMPQHESSDRIKISRKILSSADIQEEDMGNHQYSRLNSKLKEKNLVK